MALLCMRLPWQIHCEAVPFSALFPPQIERHKKVAEVVAVFGLHSAWQQECVLGLRDILASATQMSGKPVHLSEMNAE